MNLKSDVFFSEFDIVVIQFSIQDSILDHKYCNTIFCDILNILKKLDADQLEEIKIGFQVRLFLKLFLEQTKYYLFIETLELIFIVGVVRLLMLGI